MSRLRIITLLLALITLVVYLPAAHYGFLTLDDDLYVRYNQVVQNGCAGGVTTFHASNCSGLSGSLRRTRNAP